ncbi:MAG: IreB family regulatory phosphoprotein [Clostridia bacterium]|nr:IreB family regulatory phosphoprotein [Clostridia bacterium]
MPKNDNEKTLTFSIRDEKDRELRMILSTVYEALSEKGYNPINQLVGYILSEDPTYITNHKNARSLIRRIDRDELMGARVRNYLGI